MASAIKTLPWVEKDSVRTSTATQQASFGFKNKADFNLEEVKKVVAGSGKYTVTEVVKGPTHPQK